MNPNYAAAAIGVGLYATLVIARLPISAYPYMLGLFVVALVLLWAIAACIRQRKPSGYGVLAVTFATIG